MQQTASLGHGDQTRRISPIAAGLGAAFIAAAVTIAMVSNPSPAAQTAPGAQSTQCASDPLLVLVSGNGTVRFREGNYLSPRMTLSSVPQVVIFPRPREKTQITEVITVEGNATNLVTTSPTTQARNVYPSVAGVLAINARWSPAKSC
jgi:hypothetical protein